LTKRREDRAMQRRDLLVFGAATAVGRRALARAEDENWSDAARGRAMPVRVRWPDGDGPCALIVHSHGLGGSREGGDAWGEAWRSAGFAVVHLQHPGSDTEVLRSGMRALRAAASTEQLLARVGDLRFAVDEVTRLVQRGAAPWSRVRLDAIGASGHSFGAVTVQAVAGKRLGDVRFKALVAFSPSPAQGGLKGDLAAATRPVLLLTGSQDGDPLGRGLTATDRAAVFDSLPAGQRALLWLDGADHMTFAGNARAPLRGRLGPLKREAAAAEREPQHHALIAALTVQWWRAHLLGDAAATQALRAAPALGPDDRWRVG
jgi:predicted dienelactone hydrolase